MRAARLLPFVLVGAAALGCSSSSGAGSSHDASRPKDAGHAARDVAAKDSGLGEKDASSDVRATRRHDAGSDVTARPTPDAGDAGDAGGAADAADAAPFGFDAGPPPTPQGTTLDTGADFAIQGVTDDGYVVYTTRTAVKAAPVAGGAPVTIVDMGEAGAGMAGATVVHDDVFAWSNIDPSSFAGVLTLWNHTASIRQALSASSQAFVAAASADSSAILYTDASSADGMTASLLGANLASLASPSVLATRVDTSGQGCNPALAFTGAASPFHAVAAFCVVTAGADAASDGPDSVYAYPTTTWTPATLATSAAAFWTDSQGTSVAVLLASGVLEVLPLGADAGSAVVLGLADGGAVSSAYLSARDAFVLFDTSHGALVRSPVDKATPATLVAKDVAAIDRVSPSEAWAIVNKGTDPNTGLPTDLGLASTSKLGAPAILTGNSPTVAGVLGDAFTADSTSSYVIFMTGLTVDGDNNAIGKLEAARASSPGTAIPLATAAVSAFNGLTFTRPDLALTGTQISFTDNFDASRNNYGSVDLHVIDLATTTPSTTVMQGADPAYAVSFDRQRILYTITFGGITDGLYSVAVP
jgi:hypothetical protein